MVGPLPLCCARLSRCEQDRVSQISHGVTGGGQLCLNPEQEAPAERLHPEAPRLPG